MKSFQITISFALNSEGLNKISEKTVEIVREESYTMLIINNYFRIGLTDLGKETKNEAPGVSINWVILNYKVL